MNDWQKLVAERYLSISDLRKYIVDFSVESAEMRESLEILRIETDRLHRKRYNELLDAAIDNILNGAS